MSSVRDVWAKASWQVKTVVITIGFAVVVRLVLWAQAAGVVSL